MPFTHLMVEKKIVYSLVVWTPEGVMAQEQLTTLAEEVYDESDANAAYGQDTLGRMTVTESIVRTQQEPADGAAYRKANQLPDYAEYATRCPACLHDETLVVCRVTMVEDGETYLTAADLVCDGFDILYDVPTMARDYSTENEWVNCVHCKRAWPLSDLMLEG